MSTKLKMQNSQERRCAIVTGGRRGIGRGIAYALAEHGFNVAVVDVVRDEAAEETLCGLAERGARAAYFAEDISELNRHAQMIAGVQEALGPINCLVNNAGVQTYKRGDMLEVTPENFDRLIRINLRGTFFLSQAVAKQMIQNDAGDSVNPKRSIVFISSANTVIAMPHQSEYCVSKSALTMTSSLFAVRLAAHGITVNEIRPGMVHTDMTTENFDRYEKSIQGGTLLQGRWGKPSDIGKTVAMLARQELPYATGQAFNVDGGFHVRRA